MQDAQKIIDIARTWIGTKFHHQGRLKNIGVDCIGLVVGVARELGLQVDDRLNYGRQPHGGQLEAALMRHLQPCELQAGAVALFRIGKEPQHVGIIGRLESGDLSMIHAYAQSRKVVEHGLDDWWKARLIGCFKMV